MNFMYLFTDSFTHSTDTDTVPTMSGWYSQQWKQEGSTDQGRQDPSSLKASMYLRE